MLLENQFYYCDYVILIERRLIEKKNVVANLFRSLIF